MADTVAFAAAEERDYMAACDEIEALSRHLGLSQGDELVIVEAPRGGTGGSSASRSTAVGGSSVGEATTSSRGFDERSSCSRTGSRGEGRRGDFEEADPSDMYTGAQRVHHELQTQGTLPHGIRVETSAATMSQFFFSMDVAEGPYMPTTFDFWVKIFDDFPSRDSFRVRCMKRVFHPNVHTDSGRIDVPLDLADWRGSGAMRALLCAVRQLFVAPADVRACGVTPPANADAAALLKTDPDDFRRTVRLTLAGGEYRGTRYDALHAAPARASKGAKAALSATAPLPRGSTPDSVTVEVMRLEVLKEQYKEQISFWQNQNSVDASNVELSMC